MKFRWSWMQHRQTDVPSSLPNVATPVAHVEGPGRLVLDGGRLIIAGGDGVRHVALLGDALEMVVCYGPVDVSSACLANLAEQGVSLAFLTHDGSRVLSRLQPEANPRMPARVAQTRVLVDEPSKNRLARRIVVEKIHSQAAAARHYQRQGRAVAGEALSKLASLEQRAAECVDLEQLVGLEGQASALWFDVYGSLFRAPWAFTTRSRRPPRDPVNSLLSLGYTLLYNRTVAAIEAVGLEPALGALHAFRSGRMSLACDLMEPMRIPVVDRWVAAACNQRRFDATSFATDADGGCRVGPGQMPRVVADWERTWHESRWRSVLTTRVAEFTHDIREAAERLGIRWRADRIVEAKTA